MAILPPQHPLQYREGQGKAAVLAQPRVGGLTVVGPSAWANARLFPHHPIPPCPGRTPPRPPQQAVCPRHCCRQVPRRHQRAAGSRRDPQCSQGAAGEAPRCPWASPAPARAAGQGQQPLVSARTGTLASSLPQGRSDTPPTKFSPQLVRARGQPGEDPQHPQTGWARDQGAPQSCTHQLQGTPGETRHRRGAERAPGVGRGRGGFGNARRWPRVQTGERACPGGEGCGRLQAAPQVPQEAGA